MAKWNVFIIIIPSLPIEIYFYNYSIFAKSNDYLAHLGVRWYRSLPPEGNDVTGAVDDDVEDAAATAAALMNRPVLKSIFNKHCRFQKF